MAQINLLPWREELRARRNKEFGIVAGIAAFVAVIVVAGVHVFMQDRIDFQGERNAFLNQQIALLDKKIASIKELEKEKQALLARMKIIQELQSSRPEVVHLFDELVKRLPEGVYYTRITQKGAVLDIQGVAQSNARVSSLMRQMDSSPWLTDPALVEIKAYTPNAKAAAKGAQAAATAASEQLRLSEFRLTVKQTRPKKPGEEDQS